MTLEAVRPIPNEVSRMLRSYEAIYENGCLRWLDEQPNAESVRVIVTILNEQAAQPKACRATPPSLRGKVEILGDIVSPLVDEQDWECLK